MNAFGSDLGTNSSKKSGTKSRKLMHLWKVCKRGVLLNFEEKIKSRAFEAYHVL
jgi:hypothetical protein